MTGFSPADLFRLRDRKDGDDQVTFSITTSRQWHTQQKSKFWCLLLFRSWLRVWRKWNYWSEPRNRISTTSRTVNFWSMSLRIYYLVSLDFRSGSSLGQDMLYWVNEKADTEWPSRVTLSRQGSWCRRLDCWRLCARFCRAWRVNLQIVSMTWTNGALFIFSQSNASQLSADYKIG